MTTTEAADAFALAVVESGKTEIAPAVVAREKSNAVKKNGLLEIIEPKITLKDIGGLENLKRDLYEKRNLFTKAARDYGLPSPRPILVVGQAGTGKSLTATATGSIFGVPLVRLEAGKLFGSLVGQSEQNWRTAFATAKAISPACFWIDEVDGLFAGAESSGATDGGTTTRVIKAILQDMQMNSDGLFFVFTANDIDKLPDPLVDRCDVWSVDLPNHTEREQIIAIHIAKRGRKPDAYSIATLAKVTEGFSGRQIEQVWLAAMVQAFNDGKREPNNDDVTSVAERFIPTSVTMAQQIDARRKRLEGRAQPAGEQAVQVVEKKGRKLSV
jgi:SpoVK/Ycf46/Vps4 family AAA+-type ATPase